MAKKRTSIRRRPAAGYTAGPKRIRRRKLNGARRVTRRRSGRIGAVRMEGAIASVVKFSVGAIAGSFAMGMAKTIAPNFYVRSGGAVVLGLVLAKAMPKMKEVGYGVASAGVVGIGMKVLGDAGVTPAVINGARKRLSPDQMKAVVAKLRQAEGNFIQGDRLINGERLINQSMIS